MKCAFDFRRIARDALKGKWGIAVLAGLLASLLGAVASRGPELKFNFNDSGANIDFTFANQHVYSSSEGWLPELSAFIVGGAVYIVAIALLLAAARFVLGSVVSLGYSKFNLELVDRRKEAELGTMFSFFPHWKNAAIAKLLETVFVLLWSLLFIIPGIIASYSYAMTPFILAEHPEMAPREAISRSKEMMAGNRWRLFCLEFSFIGWSLLCLLTLGIGNLWLNPYKQAATAAFYRDVSGTEYAPTAPEPGCLPASEGEGQ